MTTLQGLNISALFPSVSYLTFGMGEKKLFVWKCRLVQYCGIWRFVIASFVFTNLNEESKMGHSVFIIWISISLSYIQLLRHQILICLDMKNNLSFKLMKTDLQIGDWFHPNSQVPVHVTPIHSSKFASVPCQNC